MNRVCLLNRSCSLRYSLFLLLACLLFSPVVMAKECAEVMATITSAQGVVEKRQKSGATWKKVAAQDIFCVDDMVRTQLNSRAALYLNNNSILRLNELSTITFTRSSSQGTTQLDLKKGIAHFISRIKQRFEVLTPYVNAAVDGTEFVVAVNAEYSNVTVLEGRVRVSNEQGEIRLTQGEAAQTQAGEAPVLQTRVQPWDAVSWALYYPAVSDFSALVIAAEELPEPWRARLLQSFERYKQGQISEALTEIESLPGDLPNGNIYIYRAALYLAAGQAGHASIDLDLALKQDAAQNTRNGEALALKSIIAVTQNHIDLGLKLARDATDVSPKIAATWLARSYAQQAIFDLEQARLSVKQAVKLAPENALAWARLAELHLMFGELDRALQAARRATEIAPRLARTQSVLGFAYLTRIKITAAEQAFNQAIELDQAAPLPRLGLGLAMIRRGELAFGRRQIEIAASLAPANPLIRSYLGKAYYEEKRGPLDATQFALAKELDPRDPTPYFYDAILKQTTNRPVDALENLQQSITLNDRRAVYRSRLLLDQDLAARGASLSRIYRDLGMDQLALAEGWKSIAVDPSNYSAHRFLADAYRVLPRHEIARVSELLQAQLLQPINIIPVKPRFSAAYLDPATGLAGAALNEYTSLFERNQVKLFASEGFGNNNAFDAELTVSGIYKQLSFSLGRLYSKTDGFRENNDEINDLYNIFAQFAVTPKLNIQIEHRSRDSQYGDLALRFDPDVFNPFVRTDIKQRDVRVGGHFVISPKSSVVANVMGVEREENRKDVTNLVLGESESATDQQEGYQAELQYLFQSRRYNITLGASHYDVDVKRSVEFDDALCSSPVSIPGLICATNEEVTRKHGNAYTYVNITYPDKLIWTVGASYDDYEIIGRDSQNRLNPKLGVQWQLNDKMRLRAAGFKTLKRALVANQTIEPTQIAGFNQFFDDINATTATRYGFGVDVSLTRSTNAGLEFTRRKLDVPVLGDDFTITEYRERNEDIHRAYLYLTPTKNIAISGEYQYENFSALDDDPLRRSKTHILPLSLRYFSTQGFFGKLATNYVKQTIDRAGSPTGTIDDSDTFLLVDATLGYRLPKRMGSISLSVHNLFDKNFNYYDINPWVVELVRPRFTPDRSFFAQVTLQL
ncbi:MAG: TonB-dependent receptor [Gammaproteobacteria bacterium]|nr:TonB-dependent receptor [Gammaproteobacteria bacterium]